MWESQKLGEKRRGERALLSWGYTTPHLRQVYDSLPHSSSKRHSIPQSPRGPFSVNSTQLTSKESVGSLTRSEQSTPRSVERGMVISRMRSRSTPQMKEIIHSDEWVFKASRTRHVPDAATSLPGPLWWSRQKTSDQRNSVSWQRSWKSS
jgi:hypothetical protein